MNRQSDGQALAASLRRLADKIESSTIIHAEMNQSTDPHKLQPLITETVQMVADTGLRHVTLDARYREAAQAEAFQGILEKRGEEL